MGVESGRKDIYHSKSQEKISVCLNDNNKIYILLNFESVSYWNLSQCECTHNILFPLSDERIMTDEKPVEI